MRTLASTREELPGLTDPAFQAYFLAGVSRTFALTIPQLPEPVHQIIANGYLLCRIVDTIEDEPLLGWEAKRHFCERFVQVVQGGQDAKAFSQDLTASLSERTPEAERELIRAIPRVIAITHGFSRPDRAALARCVAIMSHGMAEFQAQDLRKGLATLADMNRYCYYVAGVVGEMLTQVFCNHFPPMARLKERLLYLAVSFGQGLQMTNILKDLWEDLDRGVCWLPQEVFASYGYDLSELRPGQQNPAFAAGLRELIAITHGHLCNALEYTLLIPNSEPGVRDFCLWALGMAVLTLRKIDRNPYFSRASEVKISRRSVKAVVLATRMCHRQDRLLRWLFNAASRSLPGPAPAERLEIKKPEVATQFLSL
jgi:farnesyl-diphosphate farnesyltransferase